MNLESRLRKKYTRKRIATIIKYLKIALLLFLIGLAAFIWTHDRKTIGQSEKDAVNNGNDLDERMQVLAALEENDFDRAVKEKSLYSQHLLNDSLKISFNFNYLSNDDSEKVSAATGLNLGNDEPYYLSVDVHENCYLYLLQHTNEGKWVILFPNEKYAMLRNPLALGHLRIPQEDKWIYIANKPGRDHIVLLASRWRQKQLESMLAKTKDEQDENQLADYIEKQREASRSYPGIAFSEFQFSHKLN